MMPPDLDEVPLGTKAEYLVRPEGTGAVRQGVAVRYWDVYATGDRRLREDWTPWTGTIDLNQVEPWDAATRTGNVIGVQFGPLIPAEMPPPAGTAAREAGIRVLRALEQLKAALVDAEPHRLSCRRGDGHPVLLDDLFEDPQLFDELIVSIDLREDL